MNLTIEQLNEIINSKYKIGNKNISKTIRLTEDVVHEIDMLNYGSCFSDKLELLIIYAINSLKEK